MNDYNQVPSTGTFGEAIGKVNENFELTQTALNELEFSTRRNKGLFETLNALNAAIPYPAVGDWAMVSEGGFPADLYVCRTVGTWEDSGETYSGDNVDLTDYALKADLDDYALKADIKSTVETVTQAQYSALTPKSGIIYNIYEEV